MNVETAMLVQNIIAGLLLVLWLAAAAFVWATFRRDIVAATDEANSSSVISLGLNPGERLMVTEGETDGHAAELAAKAAQLLASGKLLGQVRVKSEGQERVAFSAVGNPLVARGLLEFQRLGNDRTRVTATFVRPKSSRVLLWLALVFSVTGLAVFTVVYVIIDQFVVRNANPSVRYQAVQMAQAVHLMWEPFLFAGIYRGQRKMAEVALKTAQETLVYNLAYFQDSTTVA